MDKVVSAFHAEVCELLDDAKTISSGLSTDRGNTLLTKSPDLLRRVEAVEQQLDFHRYFSQAAIQILGESPGYVSIHATALDDVKNFLLSIEGHTESSKALEMANFAGVVGEGTHEIAEYKKALRREAAVASDKAEPTEDRQSIAAEEPVATAAGQVGQQDAVDSRANKIPPQFRTIAMSKYRAAGYLRGGNGKIRKSARKTAVQWLNRRIEDGTYACEVISRQSFVFDSRDFPQRFHDEIGADESSEVKS